jgi:hypothetical protein
MKTQSLNVMKVKIIIFNKTNYYFVSWAHSEPKLCVMSGAWRFSTAAQAVCLPVLSTGGCHGESKAMYC